MQQMKSKTQQLIDAQADYQRTRAGYLDMLASEPDHELALAMIGADLDRAYARLKSMVNLPAQAFDIEPSAVLRRQITAQEQWVAP